jgi:uncharacterized PurR-regulated membrane protein YhhQ (DUF165 family)
LTYLLVGLYLSAIVVANLIVAHFGPAATVPTAFVLIGLDLVARDRLHDAWHRRHLWLKMGTLILAGGLISFTINSVARPIAIASCVAFVAAGLVDAVVYHLLRRKPELVRTNGSNVPAALVDSLLFPTLAFGSFLPWIVAGQFAAKVFGGFLWSLILRRDR